MNKRNHTQQHRTSPMARKVRQSRASAHCTGASTASSSSSSSLLATAATAVLLGATTAAAAAAAGLNQAAADRLLFVGPSSLPRAPAWGGARVPRNGESLESATTAVRAQRSRWCGSRGLLVGGRRQRRLKRCLPELSMAASSDEDVSKIDRLVGRGGRGGASCTSLAKRSLL